MCRRTKCWGALHPSKPPFRDAPAFLDYPLALFIALQPDASWLLSPLGQKHSHAAILIRTGLWDVRSRDMVNFVVQEMCSCGTTAMESIMGMWKFSGGS